MPGARFLPNIAVNEIQHDSERAVARALLSGLEEEWTIFHSYCWLNPTRSYKSAPLREGEVDFVLLHPARGLLVLEVKGGDVRYFPDRGLWMQNQHEMRDPFDQARRNMHALIEQLKKRGKFVGDLIHHRLPCVVGYAVVFPDSSYAGTLPPGAHAAILAGAHDLPRLGEKVADALRSWTDGGTPPAMKAMDFEQIRLGLVSTFRLVPSLARELEREGEMLIRLTDHQAEALEKIYTNARVLVEGTAGSGKTLLALQRARSYAEEGKRVLLLCYNRNLADYLNRRAQHDTLTIRHFHGLCRDLCMEAHGQFPVPPATASREEQTRFWEEEAPERMLDALDDLPEHRYDAVIVDEAQDFQNDWWVAIESLNRQSVGPLYIFFDRSQNLYGAELNFPATATHFDLRTNCRNTRRIAAVSGRVIGSEIMVSVFSPEGRNPLVHSCPSPAHVQAACRNLLETMIHQERLLPSRIAILSPYTMKNSALSNPCIGRYRLTDDLDAWMADEAVWFSTIRAFKGLEADVLILVDLFGFVDGLLDRSDLYVAVSRARHRLVVLTDSREIEDVIAEAVEA